MASVAERVSVLETKVDNFDEKFDHLQGDIKSNHQDIKTRLDDMYKASCDQHAQLADKISELEKFKNKWVYTVLGGVAVLGWVSGHIKEITTFLQ